LVIKPVPAPRSTTLAAESGSIHWIDAEGGPGRKRSYIDATSPKLPDRRFISTLADSSPAMPPPFLLI
jgi:hypothetical protein